MSARKKPVLSVADTYASIESLPLSIPSMIERHKGLMTAKKLAPMIGLGLPTLYQWAADGRIPSLNLEGQIRFDPKTIAAWVRVRVKGRAAGAG